MVEKLNESAIAHHVIYPVHMKYYQRIGDQDIRIRSTMFLSYIFRFDIFVIFVSKKANDLDLCVNCIKKEHKNLILCHLIEDTNKINLDEKIFPYVTNLLS
ncbi:hypothetical protein BpHYR1_018716 [Brachionus plicatilis]|uniref:Uncharacterized protein n=1 Tax=Brachionus plicatilis TaxID=10195 RepID=A0A3M7PI42_BRAPC|nr:hypothetical protein BpHYR1_018716 [Brachionus plicatilis]